MKLVGQYSELAWSVLKYQLLSLLLILPYSSEFLAQIGELMIWSRISSSFVVPTLKSVIFVRNFK